MKNIAIITIFVLLILFGCAKDKSAPDTATVETQEVAKTTPAEDTLTEAETPDVPESAEQKEAQKSTEPATKNDNSVYYVYYFTGKARCASCHAIENQTKESVSTNFAEEVKNGKVVFEMIDIDEPQNAHYIDDYSLFTKSVVISKRVDGKEVSSKNLERIWQLWNNKTAFMTYIRDELRTLMASESK